MLTINDLNPDHKLVVGIALSFSSDVLHFYEAKYPNDLRPRGAIESAIICLQNPSKETRATADSAAHAAFYAANAAFYAANAADAADAAYAAYAASYAAAHVTAVNAATYAAANAATAVNAATYAAATYAAANAASADANADAAARTTNAADKDKYIHDRIVKILPLILEYKVENKQSFTDAEKVLEYLKDEDKVSFLFNLDILR